MNALFYNIVSIILGLLVIGFGIMKIKKQPILLIIIAIAHGLGFLGFGIGGFFVPEKYEFITILGMLALTITLLIALLTIYDSSKDPLKPAGKKRK